MRHTMITSKAIRSMGYDPATQTLELRYTNGKTYRTTGFSPTQYADLEAAPSTGKAVNALKHAGVSFTKVEPAA
jgi:hypothetical protein